MKIIFLLFLCLVCSGCGETKMFIYSNPKGIMGIRSRETMEFEPIEDPKFIAISNRPLMAKQKVLPDGTIETEVDATNKNNIDKVVENILPLLALKEV